MKTINEFKIGDIFYYLDRNIPDNNSRIVEMVVRENPKTNNLELYGKQGYFTIKFDITNNFIEKVQNSPRPLIFRTPEEARTHYDGEIQGRVDAILNAPVHITLRELFDGWSGDHMDDYRIYEAMKQKIKKEFNVDVS